MGIHEYDVEPNSISWLRERQKSLGASDTPIILGVSHWSKPIDIKRSKVNEVYEEFLEDKYQEQLKYGHLLEGMVLEMYVAESIASEEGFRQIRQGKLTRNDDFPWLHATPDAIRTDVEGILVEAKTANPNAKARNPEDRQRWEWGEPGTDQIPDTYMIQVQQQMLVCGAERVDIPVLFLTRDAAKMLATALEVVGCYEMVTGLKDYFELYSVKKDEELQSVIVEETKKWWDKYIVGDEDPPDFERQKDDGCIINVESEDDTQLFLDACKAYREYDKAKSRVEHYKLLIQERIGEHTGLAMGNERITWKMSRPRKQVDYVELAGRLKEIAGVKDEEWNELLKNTVKEIPGSRRFNWPKAWRVNDDE